MASKEKVDIKRSDQFQEVEEELSRAMANLDSTIERVSAIFDGSADENSPDKPRPLAEDAESTEAALSDTRDEGKGAEGSPKFENESSVAQGNTSEANAE